MNYSILYKNGNLIPSKPIPIYQNDQMSNSFKFFIDLNCLEGFVPEEITCMLYYQFPGGNTFHMKRLSMDEGIFNEHYLTTSTAIIRDYTTIAGRLSIFLTIIDDSQGFSRVTNTLQIAIIPSDFQYSSESEDKTITVYTGVSNIYPESLEELTRTEILKSVLQNGFEKSYSTNNQHIIFAYPKEFGELKKITDSTGAFELQDGFDILEFGDYYCYVEQNLTTDEDNVYIFYMET